MPKLQSPFFKIVTINKNNATGLAHTIDSVRQQTFNDYDFVVVDGCSGDRSIFIIEQNLDIIDTWVSEADTGIYDAMNKGTRLGRECQYIIYLNSGDSFYSEYVLLAFYDLIMSSPISPDVAFGKTLLHDHSVSADRTYLAFDRPIGYCHINMPIYHQSIFFSYKALKNCMLPPYRASFRYAGDYDLFARLFARKAVFSGWNLPVSIFNQNGTSSTKDTQIVIYKEMYLIKREVFRRQRLAIWFDELVLRTLNKARTYKPSYSSVVRSLRWLMGRVKRALTIVRKLSITAIYFPRTLLRSRVLASIENESILRELKGKVNTVIDVGVNRGQFMLASLAFLKPDFIIGFEPVRGEHARASNLLRLLAKNVNIRLFNCGLSNSSSIRDFFVSVKSDCSSYMNPNSASPFYSKSKPSCVEKVAFEPLDRIWVNLQLPDDASILLKIDTQGSELDVLKGAKEILEARLIHYVYLECSDIEHYDGQPSFVEIFTYLRSFGYKLNNVVNCYYDSCGRLSYCDALFSF